jgi:hypothetical protein
MKPKMTKKCKVGDIVRLPNDKTRYVVVKTALTGGSTGHDAYPDAWHVTIQRFKEDGKIFGKELVFTQETNCYNNCIPEVELVAKGKLVKYLIEVK